MALSDPDPDPIDRDIELLFADPERRARLDESEARHAQGETAAQPRSDSGARRIVGLPPCQTTIHVFEADLGAGRPA
jgi:hypothetical protein